jgi:hypothetical protein
LRQILVLNESDHARAQRVAPGEEGHAAGRAFVHGPAVAEAHPGLRDGIDVRRARLIVRAIAEDAHLVDADIIHDDEQDVGGASAEARAMVPSNMPSSAMSTRLKATTAG